MFQGFWNSENWPECLLKAAKQYNLQSWKSIKKCWFLTFFHLNLMAFRQVQQPPLGQSQGWRAGRSRKSKPVSRLRVQTDRAKNSGRINKRVIFRRGVAQPGSAPALGAGGRRFKSSRPDQFFGVRPGDIGNRTFRGHRLHFWPEGVLQGLQGFLFQINIAEIVIHKTDQPDTIFNFFGADGLAGEGYAEVDLLPATSGNTQSSVPITLTV
jgi:hypothetical protein